MRRATASLVVLVLLACAPGARAQGCALCKTAAAAQGVEGVKAFNLAILVLLIPTVFIFVGIVLWAFRFRYRSLAEQNPPGGRRASPSRGVSESALILPLRPD